MLDDAIEYLKTLQLQVQVNHVVVIVQWISFFFFFSFNLPNFIIKVVCLGSLVTCRTYKFLDLAHLSGNPLFQFHPLTKRSQRKTA